MGSRFRSVWQRKRTPPDYRVEMIKEHDRIVLTAPVPTERLEEGDTRRSGGYVVGEPAPPTLCFCENVDEDVRDDARLIVGTRKRRVTAHAVLRKAPSRLPWNRLRYVKNPDTGKRVSQLNPESEWMSSSVPQLRIVPDERSMRQTPATASGGWRW